VGIARSLGSQAADPRGPLGWVAAWIMPVFSDTYCGDLARLLDLRPEDDVLEVGCGSGAFLKKHASHCRYAVGLDSSDIQIRLARKRNRDLIRAGIIEIVQGDAAALPWEEGRFSAVTCNCLGCFPEPERSLEEMHRVLRSGKRVALSFDHYQDAGEARREERRWGLRCWTEAEVCRMMRRTAFSQLSLSHDKRNLFVRATKQ
jgi:ubiquinone/menaquinone biosynthesis C-methylase UbiE